MKILEAHINAKRVMIETAKALGDQELQIEYMTGLIALQELEIDLVLTRQGKPTKFI